MALAQPRWRAERIGRAGEAVGARIIATNVWGGDHLGAEKKKLKRGNGVIEVDFAAIVGIGRVFARDLSSPEKEVGERIDRVVKIDVTAAV